MTTPEIDRRTLERVVERIRQLAPRLERQYIRSAMSRAGTVIVRAARRNLQGRPTSRSARDPQIIGLRRSIRARPSSQWPSAALQGGRGLISAEIGLIGIVVGAKWPEGAHAHLVEFGHALWVRKRGGGVRQAGRVRGHPFMDPAIKATKSEAWRIIKNAVRDGILRSLSRGGNRTLEALGLG